MTILRFIASVWLYVTILPTMYVVTPILPLFTRPDFEVKERYSWGWIYGTHDNPPQGDRAWVSKHCPYPEVLDGWKVESDKFSSPGDKAQLVFTFNPFDGYGSK